jgi:proliferating cell nuclear antigen PCNA
VGGKVGGGVVVDDGDGIVIELNNATKVQQFKTIFQNIKTFSKDLNIHLNTNSLYIQCMDNSKVSIFEMNLPASWFDKWVVPLNTVVGILTTLFFTILNLSENSIVIRYDHVVASDKLNIELMLEKCVITYELPLLDIENDVMEIPAMDYMVDMKMKSAFFFSIVDKLKKFGGENFDFECTEDAVKLFANTIEAGKISAVIQIADLTEYAIGEGESVSSFGLNYVYNIATFHKVADYIKIHFTGGEPLKMVYYLEPETADDGNIAMVTFYLAPKIDVNDDDM